MNEQIRKIAERLRGLRESVNLTPDEMAEKGKVSPADYKAYESGEADIPMSFLVETAKAFGLETSVFISGDDPHANVYFVTRKGQGISVERTKAYKYRDLAGGFRNAKAAPFLVSVEPSDEPYVLNSHDGQEFVLVEKGTLVVQIAGSEVVLNEGDSVYFDARKPHGMKALNNAKVRFLAIII